MKIVMACGGSGGHIFPAMSVAQEIRRRVPECRVIFACGKKEIEEVIFKAVPKADVVEIDGAAFLGGSALRKPLFLLKLTKGFLEARALLRRERPDLVAGFGGYFSFPVILAAKSLGLPSLVHEQNVVPGLANKVLARWVDAVALSFEETRRFIPRARRVALTGNPIRASILENRRQEALEYFNFSDKKLTLLVLGGSQGAESINRFFLDSLSYWPEAVKSKVQALHLCGRMDPAEARLASERQGVSCRAFSFFDRMDLAYSVSDLALGRAGATFLAEVEAKRIPVILVPYPFAGGHQKENARVFKMNNQALVLDQETLTPAALAEAVSARVLAEPNPKSFVQGPVEASSARDRLADLMMSLLP